MELGGAQNAFVCAWMPLGVRSFLIPSASIRPSPDERVESGEPRFIAGLVAAAVLLGLGSLYESIQRYSATYDEVKYLEIAAHWWRTGEQDVITRMGSPLTFWKLQQIPALALLDWTGHSDWLDDPIRYQQVLLPWTRLSGLWIWVLGLVVTAEWSRRLHGQYAMVAAAWWFALSPNLLAHGALITMELPVLTFWAMAWFFFWEYLRRGRIRWFVASGLVAGVAFSCKFTTVLLPPLLAVTWIVTMRLQRTRPTDMIRTLVWAMPGYLALLVLGDLLVTGFAMLPISPTVGSHPSLDGRWGPPWDDWLIRFVETPIPQDWVGFLNQMRHQKSGGWSYLFGERREQGWRYYYLVALAVKAPISMLLVLVARSVIRTASRPADTWFLLTPILGFLLLTSLASSRNYGVRYLLPIAPLAIVWVSALAARPGWGRRLLGVGLVGQALAVLSIQPDQLSYFNRLVGGPEGGRAILADSNLDWGQGALLLAQVQRQSPDYQDLTFYYFGDTDPAHYGVAGITHVVDAHAHHPRLPETLTARTRYLAVSSSLQHGPWGPRGYFDALKAVEPVYLTPDCTIAIYRTDSIPGERAVVAAQRAEDNPPLRGPVASSKLSTRKGRDPAKAALPDHRPAGRSDG